jgi:hypothetical protein
MNSFMAKAYMEELVSQGKLKLGEKVGSTNLFLLPGQEEQASKAAEELLHSTRTVGGHVGKDLDMSPEAVAKREGFKKHFEKDIARFQTEKKPEFAPLDKLDIKQIIPSESFIIEPERPKIEVKPAPVRIVQKKEEEIFRPKVEIKPVQKKGYVERIIKMFGSDKAKVVDEINIGKKAAELVLDFPSSIGAMRFYVEIKDKKSISKADVSIAYTE